MSAIVTERWTELEGFHTRRILIKFKKYVIFLHEFGLILINKRSGGS